MSPHKIEASPPLEHSDTIKLKTAAKQAAKILEIRGPQNEISLIQEIHKGLNVPQGQEKSLPTLLLYDEAGLKLFEDITYLDEYYLTNAEIQVLEQNALDMARRMPNDSILVELGSGNLRKVNLLLKAIDGLNKTVDYYALDLDKAELERTLSAIPHGAYKNVNCHGLWGTYDDGLAWLQTPENEPRPKTVLWMGSSIGNFSREGAAGFLTDFTKILKDGDRMLIGVDACMDHDKVLLAYNDPHGVTTSFTLNGLWHANRLLGGQIFDPAIWKHQGNYNSSAGRHEAFVYPTEDVTVLGVSIKSGEKVRIEESYKYSAADLDWLWHNIEVSESKQWSNASGDYAMHEIIKSPYGQPTDPLKYAASPAPTWDEWVQLWKLWDTVTRHMLPDEELLGKPIKLRNACIFYLGHIPGFFDIKLTEVYPEEGPTDPSYFHSIFERGIDPDVDNPEQCHAHSEIPDTWPALDDILAYQQRVRDRVHRMYKDGRSETVKGARALWLGFEHEGMHLETLLYMLIQSEKTLPPKGATVPQFESLARENKQRRTENKWFIIPERDITIGINDPETDSGPQRFFGWDVEKPARKAHVNSFTSSARPISNGDYARYMLETSKKDMPASWIESSTLPTSPPIDADLPQSAFVNRKVRTVFGAIPLEWALDWPVSASYDELAGCAAWMGGRIPSLEETRSIYEHAHATREAAQQRHAATIPAVNNHLLNSGVAESPPNGVAHGHANGVNGTHQQSGKDAKRSDGTVIDPLELYLDLSEANVGFRHWNPTPVTQNGDKLAGQGEMGGLWEWTSSPLLRQEGFEPMKLYEAYSQDFHDGRHNIVLGGSWATIARIAGRKSFVNWYQRNYPFVWAGARVVKDL